MIKKFVKNTYCSNYFVKLMKKIVPAIIVMILISSNINVNMTMAYDNLNQGSYIFIGDTEDYGIFDNISEFGLITNNARYRDLSFETPSLIGFDEFDENIISSSQKTFDLQNCNFYYTTIINGSSNFQNHCKIKLNNGNFIGIYGDINAEELRIQPITEETDDKDFRPFIACLGNFSSTGIRADNFENGDYIDIYCESINLERCNIVTGSIFCYGNEDVSYLEGEIFGNVYLNGDVEIRDNCRVHGSLIVSGEVYSQINLTKVVDGSVVVNKKVLKEENLSEIRFSNKIIDEIVLSGLDGKGNYLPSKEKIFRLYSDIKQNEYSIYNQMTLNRDVLYTQFIENGRDDIVTINNDDIVTISDKVVIENSIINNSTIKINNNGLLLFKQDSVILRNCKILVESYMDMNIFLPDEFEMENSEIILTNNSIGKCNIISGDTKFHMFNSKIIDEKYISENNYFSEYDESDECSNIRIYAIETEKINIRCSFISAYTVMNNAVLENGSYRFINENEIQDIGLYGILFDFSSYTNSEENINEYSESIRQFSFLYAKYPKLSVNFCVSDTKCFVNEPVCIEVFSEGKDIRNYWQVKLSDIDDNYNWYFIDNLCEKDREKFLLYDNKLIFFPSNEDEIITLRCLASDGYSCIESEPIDILVEKNNFYSNPENLSVPDCVEAHFSVDSECNLCQYKWEYYDEIMDYWLDADVYSLEYKSSEITFPAWSDIKLRCFIIPCSEHKSSQILYRSREFNGEQILKVNSIEELNSLLMYNSGEIVIQDYPNDIDSYEFDKLYFTSNKSGFYTDEASLKIISWWMDTTPVFQSCISVQLTEEFGYEYSMDGVNWQPKAYFTGLIPKQEYTFFRRLSKNNASIISDGDMFKYTPVHLYNAYGYCKDCGNIENGTDAFVSANAVVGGKIGMNFKVALSAEAAADPEARMIFTMESGKDISIPLSQATLIDAEKNIYQFTLSLTSTQMDEKVTAKMSYSDAIAYPEGKTASVLEDYSVNKYLNNIQTAEETKENPNTRLIELIKAMRNYGVYMDIYSGDTSSDFVPEDLSNRQVSVDNTYSVAIDGEVDGVTAKSASVTVGSLIDITVKFEAESDIDNLVFAIDGVQTQPVLKDGMYCVTIPEISPLNYSKMYTITVTDGQSTMSIKYSALSYVKNKLDDSDQKLVNVCKAMYLYNEAVTQYKDN